MGQVCGSRTVIAKVRASEIGTPGLPDCATWWISMSCLQKRWTMTHCSSCVMDSAGGPQCIVQRASTCLGMSRLCHVYFTSLPNSTGRSVVCIPEVDKKILTSGGVLQGGLFDEVSLSRVLDLLTKNSHTEVLVVNARALGTVLVGFSFNGTRFVVDGTRVLGRRSATLRPLLFAESKRHQRKSACDSGKIQ